jgi:anti-sigma factor RsiW
MPFLPTDLEAYLDEALPPEEMARIEKAAREEPAVAAQLASIHARRASGVHSLGEIWRQHRLSCPTREQLGSYLLGALDDGPAGYIRFHVEMVGCRYCQANLADLRSQQAGGDPTAPRRRSRYFQSSAGRLQGKGR